ncbi:MAG: cation diffusion facilitator family transporter [Mycobacteriales bacterium]
MSTSGGTKAVVAALVANLGIAVSKFVAFLFTGSASMLAESIHSLADSGNQGLLLFGGRQAKRAADEEHPFGYGRSRYFYAFVVAVVLFTLGSLFALFEGYEKLRHDEGHGIEKPGVAIGVLVVAIVLESFSFRTAIVEANHVRRGEGWFAFIRHSKSPELPVILLEDFGALVGLVLALIGVVLTAITGDGVFDALGTMSIGVLLGIIAVILAVEMRSLLIGEGANPRERVQVERMLVDHPEIDALIHLKTLYIGPEELLVAAKVSMIASLSFNDVARVINEAEVSIRDAVPTARIIYIEPDVCRPDAAAGAESARP